MSFTYACDICKNTMIEPAARIRLDYRNTPRNSGGQIRSDFHFCEKCRPLAIEKQQCMAQLISHFFSKIGEEIGVGK